MPGLDAFSFRVTLQAPYEEARGRVIQALKDEEFDIMTEIDVKATVKQKLGLDFRKYAILGVCNPSLAQRALTADLDIGLFLPCNVVLYEQDDGTTLVLIVDPEAMLGMIDNEILAPVAKRARAKLEQVAQQLGSVQK